MSVIDRSHALLSSHSLSEFLLFDFIGCWLGDEDKGTLTIAEGKNPEFMIGRIIDVKITMEPSSDTEYGER